MTNWLCRIAITIALALGVLAGSGTALAARGGSAPTHITPMDPGGGSGGGGHG